MGGVDYQQEVSAEMSAFFTNRLCMNFKDNSNLGWKTKIGGRSTEVDFGGAEKQRI